MKLDSEEHRKHLLGILGEIKATGENGCRVMYELLRAVRTAEIQEPTQAAAPWWKFWAHW